MARPPGRRKLEKEEIAVLLSVVATAVVLVQRFLTENQLLMLPGHTMALESSMRATTLALTRLQMMFSLAQVSLPLPSVRSEQKEQYSATWFLDFLATATDDKAWRDTFRMRKVSFYQLVKELEPILQRQDNMTEAISADRKLGAGLYRLAHGATFKSIGRKFGMGRNSSCKAFYEVCKGLEEKLGYLFEFPSTTEGLHSTIQGFAMQGMPNCCGALGFTHFLVEKPGEDIAADYCDFGGNYSVVMQAVVDTHGRFLDISVGWPGSMSPASILQRTRFYSRVDSSGELLQGLPLELSNRQLVPQYLVGDQVYPLLPWIMTPYEGADLTESQSIFNKVQTSARRMVDRAFGLLKAQWQLLSMRQKVDQFELLPFIVAAACVLQNFLINSGEQIIDDVQPEVNTRESLVLPKQNESAKVIRDAIAAHMSSIAHMHAQMS